MSLDVYLSNPGTEGPERWAIFIREDGQRKEISLDEWNSRYPGAQPVLCHVGGNDEVYSANITHNLNTMADAAGIYHHLWRPDEIDLKHARQLIEPLNMGLIRLKADPDAFKVHNPENGWGNYDLLVQFVEGYLAACRENPDAIVRVSR